MNDSQISGRALRAALSELRLEESGIYSPRAEIKDRLCCLEFKTDFTRYECMVDTGSMELRGVNSYPDNSGFFENYRYISV